MFSLLWIDCVLCCFGIMPGLRFWFSVGGCLFCWLFGVIGLFDFVVVSCCLCRLVVCVCVDCLIDC